MWDYLLPFCLLHNHHSIPAIVIYPWLTLMYCVKIEIFWEHQKYETIAWLVIGVVHDESILVWRKWNMTKLYDFVGITFFSHVILRRHNCFVSMLEVLLFLCQYELLSWIFRIWIFIPQLRRIALKSCQVALRIKNSVFIIYLLEDEQELSLGMLDTSPTYL